MDIFKGLLWYTYKEERAKWYKLTVSQVNEIIDINKKGEKVASLEEYETDLIEEQKDEFEDVVGQDSLTRFDAPKRGKKRKNKGRSRNKSKITQNQQKPARNQAKKTNSKNKKRRPFSKSENNKKNA